MSPSAPRHVLAGYRRRRWAGAALRWLAILLCSLGGCRTKPYVNAHIESVNAEYRQLEDYVYELEDENARLQAELEMAHSQAAAGRKPGRGGAPAGGGLFRRTPAARGGSPSSDADVAPSLEGPVIELPGQTAPSPVPGGPARTQRPSLDAENLSDPAETPPNIEPPRPASPSPVAPEGLRELLPSPADPPGVPSASPPGTLPLRPIDRKVTHLHLDRALSGGASFDSQPGDDGLRIVLEPRNAADECVAEAGNLSVVVLDPQQVGDSARLARWDFDPSEVRQLLADSSGKGLDLELPWPAAAPSAERVQIFVRYETSDGRRLQTDREIHLTPTGLAKGSWTPRSGSNSDIRNARHEAHAAMP